MAACFRLSWKACILGMALVALFCPKVSAKDAVIKSPRVVTLFEPEEKEYDRYAAAISAIEPLRVERDQRVEETLNPFFFCWMKARWGGGGAIRAPAGAGAEEAPPGRARPARAGRLQRLPGEELAGDPEPGPGRGAVQRALSGGAGLARPQAARHPAGPAVPVRLGDPAPGAARGHRGGAGLPLPRGQRAARR
ncbi:unnamed protein product, partial [Heterosigma akashiwo]